MDFLDGLQYVDKETRKQIFSIFEKLDPTGVDIPLQEKIFYGLIGAVSMKRDFDAYRVQHPSKPLENEQHPHDAHFGPSTPNGAEKYVGLVETGDEPNAGISKIGQTLVVRTSNAILFEMDGSLGADGETFLPLIKVKGIHDFTFAKDNSSRTLQDAMDYYRAGCLDGKRLPAKFDFMPSILIEDAKSFASLMQTAEKLGDKPYERVGLVAQGMDADQKLKLFAAAEDILREHRLYGQTDYAKSIDMVPVLHDEYSARHYVYLHDEGMFAQIPSRSDSPEAIDAFRDRVKVSFPKKADSLIDGYTLYLEARKANPDLSNPDSFKNGYLDTCADSRTNARMFIGTGALRQSTMMYLYRSAGNPYFGIDGRMTKPAQRFLARAAMDGGFVTHSGHGECGAVGFALKTIEQGGDGIPAGFVQYGQSLLGAYSTMQKAGPTAETIVDGYVQQTGVPFQCIQDCLAFQSVEDDLARVRSQQGAPRMIGMFQDTRGQTVHIENVNGVKGVDRYFQLPYLAGLEPLVNMKIAGPVRHGITHSVVHPVPTGI